MGCCSNGTLVYRDVGLTHYHQPPHPFPPPLRSPKEECALLILPLNLIIFILLHHYKHYHCHHYYHHHHEFKKTTYFTDIYLFLDLFAKYIRQAHTPDPLPLIGR